MHYIIVNALNDLRNEANRVEDKSARDVTMNLINVLESQFRDMEDQPIVIQAHQEDF